MNEAKHTALKKRVLLIGWDAADWQLINPLLSQGKMPALAKLMSEGAIGNLVTLDPPISPMLWTSIATGKQPYKHGIHGFTELLADGKTVVPVRVSSRKCKAIWNILGERGLRTNVVGWWPSHPAEELNGVCVSNFFAMIADEKTLDYGQPPTDSVFPESMQVSLEECRVHPAELTQEMLAPFFPDAENLTSASDPILRSCMRILAHAATIQATATRLMRTTEWDFTAIYFDALDHFCHLGMKYHPPKMANISEVDFQKYHYIIEAAYRFHDMMLERLMDLAGADCNIFLVSDHGFESGTKRLTHLPDEPGAPALEHRPYGVFAAAGPDVKPGQVYGASLLDVAPTILQLYGLPTAADMDGSPLKTLLLSFNPEKIATYESDEKSTKHDAVRHDIDQTLINQLSDLGYVNKETLQQPKLVLAENEYYLARSYAHGGLPEQALQIMANLSAGYADVARYQNFYASLLLSSGRLDALENWLAKHHSSPFSQYIKGMLLLQKGKPLAAQAVFEKINSAANEAVLLNMSRAWLRAGNREMAEAYAHKILAENAESTEVHNILGEIAMQREDWESALGNLFKSLHLLYYQKNVHEKIGACLAGLGMYQDAAQALEIALMLMPQNTVLRHQLIALYSEQVNNSARLQELIAQKTKEVVVVTGFPRSGTSMMMHMLKAGGLHVFEDAEREADTFNAQGYFEHSATKNIAINQDFLMDAEGKAVKVVLPLLRLLNPTLPLKVIWMQRDFNEIIQSQERMKGSTGKNVPLMLWQHMAHEKELHESWLNRHPHISYIEVDYNETLVQPQKTAEKVARFLGSDVDVVGMEYVVVGKE
jgi:predicted AlkP superfamily phosphohydrolase/phosphomutase/tetratricopeptide (TPR) repeat protein